MSVFDSNYERLQLADKIVHLFDTFGVRVRDLEKINDLVNDMIKSHNEVLEISEGKALGELLHWLKHEADTDDLAREYSRILADGPVRIKGETAADSEIFEDGEQIEFEEENESEKQ